MVDKWRKLNVLGTLAFLSLTTLAGHWRYPLTFAHTRSPTWNVTPRFTLGMSTVTSWNDKKDKLMGWITDTDQWAGSA